MRTPRKSAKVSDFAEMALERSAYVNVNVNRKHRKRIIKDSRQQRKDGSPANDNLKNFSGNKEAVIEEQHNADVALSKIIDLEKDSSKLEISIKDSMLFTDITRSNLIDRKRQKELPCNLIENGTLSNT